MPSQEAEGRLQGPGWKHMLQVGAWVFIFPRTLFPSRYPVLLYAPSDTAEFSRGFDRHGQSSLIYATLTLARL